MPKTWLFSLISLILSTHETVQKVFLIISPVSLLKHMFLCSSTYTYHASVVKPSETQEQRLNTRLIGSHLDYRYRARGEVEECVEDSSTIFMFC
jgi:hypothetical protein